MKPLYIKEEEVPEEFLDGEAKIYKEQLKDSGKPENLIAQILENKLKKYKADICLLSQSWVKDDTKTIKNIIEDAVGKIGENIEIKHFVRYEI
jgi:elongation factor Ts